MRLSLDAGECFLLVTPLPRTAAGNDRGCALLVLQQPGRPVGHRTLHAIFGLTPAEIELAHGLLAGRSPEEMALCRGTRIATIRSQLSSSRNAGLAASGIS